MESKLEKVTEGFKVIPITSYGLEKIKAYAKLAGTSEIYGFLLSPIDDNEGIVRDAILALNQSATGASAGINQAAAGECKAELENLGYNALGFWHSHGGFNVWHSGVDDRNLNELLGSFASCNEEKTVKSQANYCRVDGNNFQIVYRTDKCEITLKLDKGDTSYESRLVGEDYLKLLKDPSVNLLAALTEDFRVLVRDGPNMLIAKKPLVIEIKKPSDQDSRSIGAAYSIVVNRSGDLYGELAINKWCSFCENEEVDIRKDVKISPVDNLKPKLDLEALKKDLEERVLGFNSLGRKLWGSLKGIVGRD